MKLTILGCYGPYASADGACSGYLLEDKDTKILVDCGNGVLSKLLSYCDDLNKLDAIFISHLHPDHMSDLMILRYAIYLKRMTGKLKKSIPIYLPVNPVEEYERIQYKDSFVLNIINEKSEVNIKGINIRFKQTSHPIECYAMSFEKNGKKFVFSGDTKYFDDLIEFAKESDLFLCEANVLQKHITETVPHLSGKQAAEIALKADVKKLILTHIWPDINQNELLNEAKEIFTNSVELAKSDKEYFI